LRASRARTTTVRAARLPLKINGTIAVFDEPIWFDQRRGDLRSAEGQAHSARWPLPGDHIDLGAYPD
jgi:hypothetical protein